jgi:hypothetical protein
MKSHINRFPTSNSKEVAGHKSRAFSAAMNGRQDPCFDRLARWAHPFHVRNNDIYFLQTEALQNTFKSFGSAISPSEIELGNDNS